MTFSIGKIGLAAGFVAAGALGAQAATLDFTASSATSGNIGSVSWSLSATGAAGGTVNAATNYDGGNFLKGLNQGADFNQSGTDLKFKYDGVGISGTGNLQNDEVTDNGEELTLSFSKTIFLTGVHVLDLFTNGTVPGTETALAYDGVSNSLIVSLVATDLINSGADHGYAFKSVANYAVKTIKFIPGPGNDDGNGDFALAAIDYRSSDGNIPDTVPLPAGGLLLLGALGGLGLARRRK